jgi:hypothetical protein
MSSAMKKQRLFIDGQEATGMAGWQITVSPGMAGMGSELEIVYLDGSTEMHTGATVKQKDGAIHITTARGGIVSPSVKLSYGRMHIYSEARRTPKDNLDAAMLALSIALDVPVGNLAEYAREQGKEIIVEYYRSY